MSLLSCNCRCRCTTAAILVSLIAGIVAAFLQITSVIAIAPLFLGIGFGVAALYLAILFLGAALRRRSEEGNCRCPALNAILIGILGTILFSLVLILVDVAAASVIGAILVGLLVFFFSLIFTATACLVRTLFDCQTS